MFNKILLPVDLDEAEMTKLAIDEAIPLAKAPAAQLRLVNVLSIGLAPIFEFASPNFEGDVHLIAEKQLADIAAEIDYPQERVSTIVRLGSIYDETLTEAGDWGADLIVVCSQRPTMATYLLGSNAAKIVRHAKCSVLVVRR